MGTQSTWESTSDSRQVNIVTSVLHSTLPLLLLLGLSSAQQRFFRAKFEDCGSILDIPPALRGSVQMTAPFNRKTGRHVLGKGKEVQICIEGNLTAAANLPLPISAPFGLKNSAHGQVELGPLTVPLPVEFCSITVDGCEGVVPACSAMQAGDSVKLCSSLTVPTESPDVNVQVTWKVLLENNFKNECETTYDIDALKSEGKFPLVCIKIPARVQVPRG